MRFLSDPTPARLRGFGIFLAVLFCLCGAGTARASEDLIGADLVHVVAADEVLVDLAVRYRVGYVELAAANPGVNPWVPDIGTELLIPGRHILPDAPREGIVLNLAELRLYHFAADGRIATMPIGIGSDGQETPQGETSVVGKRKDPTWIPPDSVRREQPDLPAAIGPGPANPLGAYALDLGWPLYRIHGTNRPYGVGRRVSHGCIRLYPADIERLFAAVPVGTVVRVVDQQVKAGWSGGRLFLEVHPTQKQADDIEEGRPPGFAFAEDPVQRILNALGESIAADVIDWDAVERIARERRGVPEPITAAVQK